MDEFFAILPPTPPGRNGGRYGGRPAAKDSQESSVSSPLKCYLTLSLRKVLLMYLFSTAIPLTATWIDFCCLPL
ncbi:hypothetical protein TNCT_735561 [Trichonephila clavata]|uniref:Uncharacterized protein n=1 Tax=Trichonephila clavata TaxID=2740835 RepID=A0A8X6HZQ8_TRICU|nr:hypothetical protein TNCT_735561 [Trichonephila clavata]